MSHRNYWVRLVLIGFMAFSMSLTSYGDDTESPELRALRITIEVQEPGIEGFVLVDALSHLVIDKAPNSELSKKEKKEARADLAKIKRDYEQSGLTRNDYVSALNIALEEQDADPENEYLKIVVEALTHRLTGSDLKALESSTESCRLHDDMDLLGSNFLSLTDTTLVSKHVLEQGVPKSGKKKYRSRKARKMRRLELAESTSLSSAMGLHNFGVSCFANASFKLLMAHPGILELTKPKSAEAIAKLSEGEKAREEFKGELHGLLTDLMQRRENVMSIPPRRVERNLGFQERLDTLFDKFKKVPGREGFDYNEQEDAGQFLATVLDVLGYSSKNGGAKVKNTRYLTGPSLDGHGQMNKKVMRQKLTNENIITIPADTPDILSTAQAFQAYSEHSNLDLNLSSFQDLDERYGQILPKDQKKYKVEQSFVLSGVSNSLIVSIAKNLNELGQKDDREVEITNPLEVPVEVVRKGKTVRNIVKMVPSAVIVHSGDTQKVQEFSESGEVVNEFETSGGHYYTYIYDQEKKAWYMHDDRSVTLLEGQALETAQEDMRRHATTVLYQRQTK